jgi:hypothetical protein
LRALPPRADVLCWYSFEGADVRPLRSEPTDATNASKAVNDPDVVVFLGTYNSGAARASIPILCQGNLVMISPANTYLGLTKNIPHNAPNEPDLYDPECRRKSVRVAATDDLQGANAEHRSGLLSCCCSSGMTPA